MNCDLWRKAVHYCGNTTHFLNGNSFLYSNTEKLIKKIEREREHGDAAENKGGGGGGKCLISTRTPQTVHWQRLFSSREYQRIYKHRILYSANWNFVSEWIMLIKHRSNLKLENGRTWFNNTFLCNCERCLRTVMLASAAIFSFLQPHQCWGFPEGGDCIDVTSQLRWSHGGSFEGTLPEHWIEPFDTATLLNRFIIKRQILQRLSTIWDL